MRCHRNTGRIFGARPQVRARRITSRATLLADVRDRSKRRAAVVEAIENLLRQGPLQDAEEAAICAAALSRRKLWERGLSMLSEANFLAGTKGLNAAVKTCRSASQWELAIWLAMEHKETKRDGLTYSMVLSACGEGSVWELALRVWREAMALGQVGGLGGGRPRRQRGHRSLRKGEAVATGRCTALLHRAVRCGRLRSRDRCMSTGRAVAGSSCGA